jgi:hypothetical protein
MFNPIRQGGIKLDMEEPIPIRRNEDNRKTETLADKIFPAGDPQPTEAVVHAGSLTLDRPGGQQAMASYLRNEDADRVVLVHDGEQALHEEAMRAHVEEIQTRDSSLRSDEQAAANIAVRRGAQRLDFAIDSTGVRARDGSPLRWLTLADADAMSRWSRLDRRVRDKLCAASLAVRRGVARVRIGNPRALRQDRATEIIPDPALPQTRRGRMPRPWTVAPLQPLAAAQRAPHSVPTPFAPRRIRQVSMSRG